MLAFLDTRSDLDIYLEEGESPLSIKSELLSGRLVSGPWPSWSIRTLTLGIDANFARDHGNGRTGARFEGEVLHIRLAEAAYADLVRENIFSERYALRDGSKICIAPYNHWQYSREYTTLKDGLDMLKEHGRIKD